VTAGLGLYVGGASTALTILRTDYASGPGLAYPLETLQAIALCASQGIVVRDPAVIERLAKVDLLVFGQHAALEATEPEVVSIRVFPGHTEYHVLRYAATALRDLDDERAFALRMACRERRIPLLDRIPLDFGPDVTLTYKGQIIKVGNLGAQGPAPDPGSRGRSHVPASSLDSLMVGINGQIAGLIHFRHSDRLRAAAALREVRERAGNPLTVGIVSERPESQVGALALAIGADFHFGRVGTGDLARLLRACRRRGFTVAFVGDCLVHDHAAREADVAIGLDGGRLLDNLDRWPSLIVLLQPDLAKIGVLYHVARVCHRRIRIAQGSALIPNLFCVAGAFFLGFTSLATVVVTNLGTYSTYARTLASIRGLERQFARSSARGASLAGRDPAKSL
jgi:cation transport ATPase